MMNILISSQFNKKIYEWWSGWYSQRMGGIRFRAYL